MKFLLLIENLSFDVWSIIILLIPEALLVMGVGVLLACLLSRYITKPIISLSNIISNLNNEQDVSLKNRCDEIGLLYDAYYEMRRSIEEYACRLQCKEHERVELEFRLYQYRINPHMLYNTLDSISWLAIESDNRKIVQMSSMLADLYRSIVSHDGFMAKISEEIEFVTKYVELQKLRYEKDIKFEVKCDDESNKELIPQCIIQPFVENSIIHNFNTVDDLHIKISIVCDDTSMEINIEDNGQCDNIEELKNGKGILYSKNQWR